MQWGAVHLGAVCAVPCTGHSWQSAYVGAGTPIHSVKLEAVFQSPLEHLLALAAEFDLQTLWNKVGSHAGARYNYSAAAGMDLGLMSGQHQTCFRNTVALPTCSTCMPRSAGAMRSWG